MSVLQKQKTEIIILEKMGDLNNELCETEDYDAAENLTASIVVLCEILLAIHIEDISDAIQILEDISCKQPTEHIAGGPSLPYRNIQNTISALRSR